jgi:MFS family permease
MTRVFADDATGPIMLTDETVTPAADASPIHTAAATQQPRKGAGTALAALRHRNFRILLSGTFASSVGSWMQTLVVGPYALALTKTTTNPKGSAGFVGTIAIAQFAPGLCLAMVGGVLANRYPRRPILLVSQSMQALCALSLAVMVLTHPTKLGLFLGVLGGGVCNALSGPSYQAILPNLVPREDLPGVVALNSAQINGSRVIGPALMLGLAPLGVTARTVNGVAAALIINAVTFLFAIVAIARIPIAPTPPRQVHTGRGGELFYGVRAARSNPVAGRLLISMFLMTALCLPFVGQFPTVAERIFKMDSKSTVYSWLYGTWAAGAMLGGLSIATVFARIDKRRMIRFSFFGFALALAAFANAPSRPLVFLSGFVLGFFYFGTTTAMVTVLQQYVTDRDRAPIMALWFMSFGGTVWIGAKLGGYFMDHWSTQGTLMVGAYVALVLGALADFVKRSVGVPVSF